MEEAACRKEAGRAAAKKLYLIRHAESEHNLFSALPGNAKVDPYLWDCNVTEKGRQQIEQLQERVKDIEVDLIVCSPLTRALQTCLGGFAGRNQTVVVTDLCRERLENACDFGRLAKELVEDFPTVDFSALPSGIWWYIPEELSAQITEENYKELFREHRWKEPLAEMAERIEAFKRWLLAREEQTIAVVSHSTFLRDMMGAPSKMPNCDVQVMEL
ncbi:Phosphoglycerate mutase [Balamuthia mandrillaris]